MNSLRTSVLAALCLSAVGLGAQAPAPATPASAAASAPAAPTIRAEVRAPLLAAQTLIGEKNFAKAKEELALARAVPEPSPYEKYLTARIALTLAINEDDAATAGAQLEAILQLNAQGQWLKDADTLPLMHAVGIAHYRIKDYAPAAAWLERNIKAGGTGNQAVRDARIQSYLLAGNLARGAELLDEELARSAQAGALPTKTHLELLAQTRSGLKDTAASTRALELLVQHYPSKDSWRSLVNRIWSRSDLASRLQVDVFRLAFFLGIQEEANDYTEYADFAQRSGFSAEALRAYDLGVGAGVIGGAEAHKKLRAKLVQEVEQDRKTLKADLAAARKKPDGLALFNIGFNLAGMQDTDAGIEAMEQALTKGLAKRPEEARLRLAVVYAQAGRTEKALQLLANVSGPEGLDDLVRYWKLALRKS